MGQMSCQKKVKFWKEKIFYFNMQEKNDNVLISPHIAGLTYESETKAIRTVLKKLITYYKCLLYLKYFPNILVI